MESLDSSARNRSTTSIFCFTLASLALASTSSVSLCSVAIPREVTTVTPTEEEEEGITVTRMAVAGRNIGMVPGIHMVMGTTMDIRMVLEPDMLGIRTTTTMGMTAEKVYGSNSSDYSSFHHHHQQ